MSVTLADLGTNNNENFSASRWSWMAALEIIKSLGVVDDNTIKMLKTGHIDVEISKDEARRIAEKIKQDFIPRMGEKSRIYSNLAITDDVDDGTLYNSPEEQWKNYSATREWLESFAAFCETSNGFRIF